MLTLTDKAVAKVKEALESHAEEGAIVGIRVSVLGGGCSGFQYSMSLEHEAQDGDEVVSVDGLEIYVDEQSQRFLAGTEIDYLETSHGAGFKFNNPNVSSTCGCGESFQV
jgi:iron-sulfur cluster assembly accessory protein